MDKISVSVSTDKLKDKVINELFEAPFWDDVGFACINCGTCTYLCPTCWCFDIQDEVLGTQGDRIRNWDSCMFPLFTLHGSGHNPRDKKVQRVRQRFMHKLKYYVDKYNNGVQCSGCGRCVRYCPVNIDIQAFLKLIAEGRFIEAALKVKEENALPAICGRVCPQETQCEELCVLGKKGEPVAIGNLERFVASLETRTELPGAA